MWKALNVFIEGIVDAWKKLEPMTKILIGVFIIGIVYVVSISRTDSQTNDRFLKKELEEWKTRVEKCEELVLRCEEKWGRKYDSIITIVLKNNTEINQIKLEVK